MESENELVSDVIPCSFCDMVYPFKYQVYPTTTSRWDDALYAIPVDGTVCSVDRIVAEYGVHRLMEYLKKYENLQKIHCICNYGKYFNLFQLPVNFKNVTSLNLYGIFLSDGGVWNLVQNFTKLEELVIRVESRVRCRSLKNLYKRNSCLKHLSIIGHRPNSQCTCLLAIPKVITNFSMFNCSYSNIFMDMIVSWSCLEILRVDHCFYLPDDFIKSVLNLKPDLYLFQCNFIYKKVNAAMDYFAFTECNITTLKLVNNVHASDSVLALICDTCPNLQKLLLGHLCLQNRPVITCVPLPKCMLTDIGVSKLEKLKHLSCLGLYGLHSADDNNLYLNNLTRCTNLKMLIMTTCGSNITDVGCDIIRYCTKIKRLGLLGYNFSTKDVNAVRDLLQEIKPNEIDPELQESIIILFISTAIDDIYKMFISNERPLISICSNVSDDLILEL